MLFLAESPTKFPPEGVNETIDGVIRLPCSFGIISTFPFLYFKLKKNL
jgi:hypothetical protein